LRETPAKACQQGTFHHVELASSRRSPW
jgi:hypothetical protein